MSKLPVLKVFDAPPRNIIWSENKFWNPNNTFISIDDFVTWERMI
jgi:hypothetical protein